MSKLKNPYSREHDGMDFFFFLFFVSSIVLAIVKLEWQLDISWIVVLCPIFAPAIITVLVVLFFEIRDGIINKAKDEAKINR